MVRGDGGGGRNSGCGTQTLMMTADGRKMQRERKKRGDKERKKRIEDEKKEKNTEK